jgi:hypothetical protein
LLLQAQHTRAAFSHRLVAGKICLTCPHIVVPLIRFIQSFSTCGNSPKLERMQQPRVASLGGHENADSKTQTSLTSQKNECILCSFPNVQPGAPMPKSQFAQLEVPDSLSRQVQRMDVAARMTQRCSLLFDSLCARV